MLLVSGAATACGCAVPDFSRSISEADLVVVARVLTFKALDQVTLLPTEVFKGSASQAFTIQTGRSDCDFFLPPISPRVGDEYLLLLRQSEGRLTASRCMASGRTAEKAMELRVLRNRFTPNAERATK